MLFQRRLDSFLGEAHVHQALNLLFLDLRRGVFLHPLLRVLLVQFQIRLVLAGDDCILRVVGFGSAQQCLQRQQGGSNRKSRRPFILEDVEADGAGLAGNVGMPDAGLELHLGRLVGILRGKLNIDLVDTTFIAGIGLQSVLAYRPVDVSLPVIEAVIHKADLDAACFRLR